MSFDLKNYCLSTNPLEKLSTTLSPEVCPLITYNDFAPIQKFRVYTEDTDLLIDLMREQGMENVVDIVDFERLFGGTS